jgi:hypothetical protein
MVSSITRTKKNRPQRDPEANKPRPTTPINILGASKAGSVITITFNQPVALKGVPQYDANVVGVEPLSATMTSPTVMALTYSAAVTAVTLLTIPYEEPAVRNSSGGFVANSTFPIT